MEMPLIAGKRKWADVQSQYGRLIFNVYDLGPCGFLC